MNQNKNFQKYSHYYDLLNADKNYDKEVKKIHEMILAHSSDSKSILEFGSGTGKHAIRLVKDYGYSLQGVEFSKEMVSSAASTVGFDLKHGDIRTIQFEKKFDTVVSLFHVLSYQTDNSSVEAVFSNASRHLNPNGLFIFDFWFTPAVIKIGPDRKVKHAQHKHIKIKTTAIPVSDYLNNIVNVEFKIEVLIKKNNEVNGFSEMHRMRHFSLVELDYFASLFGLKRVVSQELLTGDQPGLDTWAVCSVYRKQ